MFLINVLLKKAQRRAMKKCVIISSLIIKLELSLKIKTNFSSLVSGGQRGS